MIFSLTQGPQAVVQVQLFHTSTACPETKLDCTEVKSFGARHLQTPGDVGLMWDKCDHPRVE